MSQVEGIPVPDLRVTYHGLDEFIEVMKYFRLKLIAYPISDSNRADFVVEVKNWVNDDFVMHDKFNRSSYTNRAQVGYGNPFFDKLLRKIAKRFNLKEKALLLVSLTPKEVDLYFRYKQVEAAKRMGIDPTQVSITYGQYYKTNVGWILIIDKLQLKDGTMVAVKDFELKEISA